MHDGKRKVDYWLTPNGLTLLEGWTREGATYAEICKKIGIAASTLFIWREKYKEIDNALARAREIVDFEIEAGLYKNAMGYDYVEKITDYDDDGNIKSVREMIRHKPPDVSAQKFWLANRKNKCWQDKPVPVPVDDGAQTGVVLMPPIADGADADGK